MAHSTEKALAKALIRLMEKKPLGKITISELAAEADVNRMTFYYHFQDIYDLVTWIVEENMKETLDGKKSFNTWQEGYRAILETVRIHRVFVRNVYSSVSRERIEEYLYRFVRDMLEPVVEEQAFGKGLSAEDKHLITSFYRYGFIGLAMEWVDHGMKEDPDELVERLSRLLKGSMMQGIANLSGE